MKIKYIPTEDIRSEDFGRLIKEKYPKFIKEKNPDVILVSGGDGALLHAIQKYNNLGVPFLGRAAGTLNFLMNRFENDEKVINSLIKNDLNLHFLKTNTIKIEIKRQKKRKKKVGSAINEVVVGSNIMGYHHFLINSKDESFEDFEIKGSGICVSTDLGSTGYNFNLGSSVIPLGSDFWSITGVVANRYLKDILSSQEIKITCLSLKPLESIFIDGIEHDFNLEQGDTIILSKGQVIKIAFIDKTDFLRRRIDITSRFRKG